MLSVVPPPSVACSFTAVTAPDKDSPLRLVWIRLRPPPAACEGAPVDAKLGVLLQPAERQRKPAVLQKITIIRQDFLRAAGGGVRLLRDDAAGVNAQAEFLGSVAHVG